MDTYEYTVLLKIRVPAFNEDDAEEVIEDAFGLGDNCGTEVYERTVTPLGPRKN